MSLGPTDSAAHGGTEISLDLSFRLCIFGFKHMEDKLHATSNGVVILGTVLRISGFTSFIFDMLHLLPRRDPALAVFRIQVERRIFLRKLDTF